MTNRPDQTGKVLHLHPEASRSLSERRDTQESSAVLDTIAEIDLGNTLKPYTAQDEVARLNLLQKLTAEGKKTNILAVKKSERKTAMDRTRRKYGEMESARQATNRLFAALNEHFSAEDAKELKDLARHVIGYYLNTHQYHSAPHALGMAREILQVAEISGYRDPKLLKALVIIALYHDAGNGLRPVPPIGENADEVQGFKILMEDIKTAENMADLESTGELKNPQHHLSALKNIRKEMLILKEGGKSIKYPALDIIAASIAATVFRDRFAESDSAAFDDYAISILEILYGKKSSDIPVTALPNIKRLMNNGPAWLSKNADISGSTNTANVLQANLANRLEDYRRGLAKDAGPEGYHGGFIGFISGMFQPGTPSAPVAQARQGAPFYMPDGDFKASENYGRQRLMEERERFEQLMVSNKSIIVALYAIMYRGLEQGENMLEWPLSRVRTELEKICAKEGGLQSELAEVQQMGVMTKEQDKSLNLEITEQTHPLLFDTDLEQKTIAELAPGVVNRIFAPNAARATTAARQKLAKAIETIGEEPRWEEVESLPGIGKLSDEQKILIDERGTTKKGKESAQYWNNLRKTGLSIEQIRALVACKKIYLEGGQEEMQIMEMLEDLESATTIDERPCLSRLLEVADLNPDILHIETFSAGEAMIHEGEKPERVLVIVKGRAMVKLKNGQDVILGQGSIMGEISALTGKGAVASVVAGTHEDVVCVSLPSFELVQNYQNEDLRVHAARLAAKRLGVDLSSN